MTRKKETQGTSLFCWDTGSASGVFCASLPFSPSPLATIAFWIASVMRSWLNGTRRPSRFRMTLKGGVVVRRMVCGSLVIPRVRVIFLILHYSRRYRGSTLASGIVARRARVIHGCPRRTRNIYYNTQYNIYFTVPLLLLEGR